jgi:hypothetical protein
LHPFLVLISYLLRTDVVVAPDPQIALSSGDGQAVIKSLVSTTSSSPISPLHILECIDAIHQIFQAIFLVYFGLFLMSRCSSCSSRNHPKIVAKFEDIQ